MYFLIGLNRHHLAAGSNRNCISKDLLMLDWYVLGGVWTGGAWRAVRDWHIHFLGEWDLAGYAEAQVLGVEIDVEFEIEGVDSVCVGGVAGRLLPHYK